MSVRSTDTVGNRTQEQTVADQMDCDLDSFVRRALNQAGRAPEHREHWHKIARLLEAVRGPVRQRMHEEDRKATQ
jgi:hypothetical protein